MAAIELAYGIVENPAKALDRVRRGDLPALGPAWAIIEPGTPALRLNSHGWCTLSADVAQCLAGTDALFEYCRERLCNRVSVFSIKIRSFLGAYMDFVRDEVERRRHEFEAMNAATGFPVELGFPSYRDWAFSALLPLPNVYLPVGDGHVRIDILYWNGTSAIAVILAGRDMPTAHERRALDHFQDAHPSVKVASLAAPTATSQWTLEAAMCEQVIGDVFAAGGLPFGPYRVLTS